MWQWFDEDDFYERFKSLGQWVAFEAQLAIDLEQLREMIPHQPAFGPDGPWAEAGPFERWFAHTDKGPVIVTGYEGIGVTSIASRATPGRYGWQALDWFEPMPPWLIENLRWLAPQNRDYHAWVLRYELQGVDFNELYCSASKLAVLELQEFLIQHSFPLNTFITPFETR